MRGEDSEQDDMGGLIDAAGSEYRKVGQVAGGGQNEPLTPRLGLFLPQDSSEKIQKDEELEDAGKIEEEAETSVYFNDDVQQQLKLYKEQKKQFMLQNNQPTAQSNLEEIFKNFTVVTQQRHKIKLNEVNNFTSGPIIKPDEAKKIDTDGSLISCIFSQINPFAQFVIKDIFEDSQRFAA